MEQKRIRERIDLTRVNTAIVMAGIVIAAVLRQMSRLSQNPSVDGAVTVLRPVIYIVMFGMWGVSVRKRIVNRNIRNLLTAIAILMIFWINVRTVKYSAESYAVIRYAWYLYYIPQLFIPTLFFIVSFMNSFLATLGLRCFARAFSSCSVQGLLLRCWGFSLGWL